MRKRSLVLIFGGLPAALLLFYVAHYERPEVVNPILMEFLKRQ